MFDVAVNNSEFELMLASVVKRYGVDLTGYSRKSLIRRVSHFITKSGIEHLADLSQRILHDRVFFLRFLNDISVSVTEFFRDPSVFFSVNRLVLPVLSSLPYIKIWHAGCASGQEVFSLAILLHEAGLLERSTIYATDISRSALDKAREGIYAKAEMQRMASSYKKVGGAHQFHDYFTEKYGHVRIQSFLRDRIAFAEHDLVTHAHLTEINLLLCRNVFIYFDRILQKQITEKFSGSVIEGGFLVLGTSESLQFIDDKENFVGFSLPHRIYQRKFQSRTGF